MEEMLDNFSNNYSSRRIFSKEPPRVEENYYTTHQSLDKGSESGIHIPFYMILFILVFLGGIFAGKNKIFSRFFPQSAGMVVLPNNYVITSIDNKFPIIINEHDLRIKEELSPESTVTSLFDDAALNLCMKGDGVAEVGAHYGYNAIMLGQILKTGEKYVAIEANPSVAKCLRKNLMLNDLLENVEIIEKAASNQKGSGLMEDIISLIKSESGFDKIVTNTVSIECETLNEMLKDKGISLILIGVPNAAFAILKGADKIIDESDNIRILAHLDMERVDKSIDIRDALTFLTEHGLKFYEVVSANSIKEIFIDEIINKKEFVVLMKKDK